MAASIREALSSSGTMVEAWPSSVCQLWAAVARAFCLSLGAVAGEMAGLVTVVTVASGWRGGGSGVILETAWSLTSVSLGSAEVHWDLRVVIGPRGVRGVVLVLGAVPLVGLAGAVSLVVLGASISSEPLPVS